MEKPTHQIPVTGSSELTRRKPYETPKLVTYGDIREVTANLGDTSAKPDGAGGKTNKTA